MTKDKDMLPQRTIISIFPTADSEDATLFVRSLVRYNMIGHLFPNLQTLSEKKESIQDDATILLIDPRNALLLKDPTSLFAFYEKMTAGKEHDFLYSASPKYDPSLAFTGLGNDQLMPGLCIMTGKMLKHLISALDERYGPKLHEQRTITEADLQDYVRSKGVEVSLDRQRRFLVYPKYRLDVGSSLTIDDGKLDFANPNGHSYTPYVLTRCENGELRTIAKKLAYKVPDRKSDAITDNLEKWYNGVRSYFV